MNTDKNEIPEIIKGVWYLSKETIIKMTKSDDFDLETLIESYHLAALIEDKELLEQIEEVLKNFDPMLEIHLRVTSSDIEMIAEKTAKLQIISIEKNDDKIRIKGIEDDGTETDFLFENENVLVKSVEGTMNFVRNKADLLG